MRCAALALAVFALVQTPQPATIRIFGAVATPLTLTAADLSRQRRTILHMKGFGLPPDSPIASYEGVGVRELLTRAGVPSGDALRGPELAKTVIITGADGNRVAFALAEFEPTDRGVSMGLLADRLNNAPLPEGVGPFQLVISSDQRSIRWVRQVVSIEVRQ